jgi:hypothetical protein
MQLKGQMMGKEMHPPRILQLPLAQSTIGCGDGRVFIGVISFDLNFISIRVGEDT